MSEAVVMVIDDRGTSELSDEVVDEDEGEDEEG